MIFLDVASLWTSVYILVGMLNVTSSPWERLALSFALGLGLKSLLLFVMVALGMPLDIFIQTMASLTALIVVAIVRRKHFRLPATSYAPEKTSFKIAVVGIPGVLFLLSLGNAGFFPITEADGIWYHIRGILFAHGSGFDSPTMNAQFRQYPPLVPLVFAYLISQGFEKVKLIFPFIYLCLLVIFYFRVVEESKHPKIASVFTLILGTTPYFWWHSGLPFLDLATGFYYSVGALYWFFLIQRIFSQEGQSLEAESHSLAIVSGTCFGVAAWTRMEFLLYDAIPLLIICLTLNHNTVIPKRLRSKVLLNFAVPLLFFSSLWFLTLSTFTSPLERRVLAVGGVCIGLWLMVLAFVKWDFNLQRKRLIALGGLALLLYCILMIVGGPHSVSLGKALLIALTRSLSVHIFYALTVLLVFFLFWENLRKLPEPKKLLGIFLILYPLVHFAIFSYSEPKWSDLEAYADAVLLHPGHSINLSDTRAMMAFYPILVFFIAGLSVVKNHFAIAQETSISKLSYALIAGNLLVLSVVFMIPRVQFFLSHHDLSPDELGETVGTPDMPNQFSETYRVANRIRELTTDDATLFMPPGDRPQGSFRSVVIQSLYPRKIVFGDDADFENLLKVSQGTPSYFIFSPKWHSEFCGERPRINLNGSGFGMCRLES